MPTPAVRAGTASRTALPARSAAVAKPALPPKSGASATPRPRAPRERSRAQDQRKLASAPVLMPLHDGVVYGPIRSRRLGRSLGINLLPAHLKLCTFNCSYCQYGWTHQSRRAGGAIVDNWPAPSAIIKAVSAAVKSLLAKGEHIDRLTLAGHGEPTMHPQFPEIVRGLRTVRTQLVPGVPIALLSNSSTLGRPEIRKALLQIDERYLKLDAGDAQTLRSINSSSLPFDQIVDGLKSVPEVIIQSMFVKDRTGRIDNTSDFAVINWIGALQRIRPKAVHIYTLDRAPAWPYLQPAPAARLREIQQRVRMAGFECEVFGIPNLEEATVTDLAVRH
jgi:wyosine [tRNA(Phe)-imidazoG37] synthetase (radical SAM superfamily)